MAQDKFKSVAATFQIFKDGEAVSARKLDGIIRRTQDGAEDIQRSLGDMVNQGLAFSGLPLFHNSIARAIGPADKMSVPPLRVFETPQTLDSQGQGLVRFPYSTAASVDIGNKSQNLLPLITQSDKVGIGCVNDEGSICVARFDQIYDEEKNILPNGLFDQQLNRWETSGVVFDGDFAGMETVTRYNSLTYSEDFTQWINVSGTLTSRALDNPDGGSNAMMYNPVQDGTELVYLALSGQTATSSTDWCFSVWLATSGSQVTTFLEIDGATHVRGTYKRGAVDPAGNIYSVDVSGMLWNRYYVYGTTAAQSEAVARIHLGRGNAVTAEDKIFIWGAQLEPTTYPSEYQVTTGTEVSGHYGETYIGQTLKVIPNKWYQISVDWQSISGTTWSLVQDGNILVANSTDATVTQTFKAPRDAGARFVGFRDMNVHIHVSGGPTETGPMQLKTFRVDPGTPCHAMNCPGFSAYEKTRRYRATLPTITESNNQYFGSQLQFPDEVNLAENPNLPGNIMGVFDHEQNHSVPDRLVGWRLANWPIGNDLAAGGVTDPNFLSDWTTAGGATYPSEFVPSGTGTLDRGVNTSLITSYQNFTGNNTEALLIIESGTGGGWGTPDYDNGLWDGDGSNNIFGKIQSSRRLRFRFKPFAWLKGNSLDGNGFALFTQHTNGGGLNGTNADADTQVIGITDNGHLVIDFDTISSVNSVANDVAIRYGEWNDVEVVISGNQSKGEGPHILGYINGAFACSGSFNTSDWGGDLHLAAADNHWFVNSRVGGDSMRGYIAGWQVDAAWSWGRYHGAKEPGKRIIPFPAVFPRNSNNQVGAWPLNKAEDDTASTTYDVRGTSNIAKYNASIEANDWHIEDKRTTSDLGLIGLRQLGHHSWSANKFGRTTVQDDTGSRFGDGGGKRNHWRLYNKYTDSNAFGGGYFECIFSIQSGLNNTSDAIFLRRHVPGGISGVQVLNYEFGINVSGGPYLTMAGFNAADAGSYSPINDHPSVTSTVPSGYEALYCGNAPSGVTYSGNWSFNCSNAAVANRPTFTNFIDVRDGNVHHVLVAISEEGASAQSDWKAVLYVDGVVQGSGTYLGPNQSGVDWTEWDDSAGGGDRGYYDWSQDNILAASGSMAFEAFTANDPEFRASGTLYQFSFHEGTNFPWNFSTSGFHDSTRRIPFPMATPNTRWSFLHTTLGEGFGDEFCTYSENGYAWNDPQPWPYPLWDIALAASGYEAVYSPFDPLGQDEYVPSSTDNTLRFWFDGIWALSGMDVGTRISGAQDRSSYGIDLEAYTGATNQMPVVRLPDRYPTMADGTQRKLMAMDDGNDWFISLDEQLRITGDYTVAVVYNIQDGLFQLFGDRSSSAGNDGMSVPTTTTDFMRVYYDEAQGSNGQPLSKAMSDINNNTLVPGELMVAIVRRDASNDHYVLLHGDDATIQPSPLNDSTRLNMYGLFTLDTDSQSGAGSQIAELILWDNDIGAENARKLHNYLAKKWRCDKRTTLDEAAYTWVINEDIATVTTSGTPGDWLTLTAVSGTEAGIEKSFNIEEGTIATWQYHIRGNLSYPGIKETYTLASGTAEIDPELTNTWINLSGANNPYTNLYQISGTTIPGDDEFWAEYVNGGWDITRRVKATSDNTWIKLGVSLLGGVDVPPSTVTIESFDLLTQRAGSSRFNYSCEPVLGLNWDGRGEYVRNENLFQFSNNLLLWQSTGLTRTVDTDESEWVRLSGNTGSFYQAISGADLLDNTFTLTWQSAAPIIGSGLVTITQGTNIQTFDWTLLTQPTSGIILFSGISHETDANLEVRWTLYTDDAIVSNPQLVHGSGLVDYIPTSAEPVKKYRRVISPASPQTVDNTWASGYALVEGGIIQTTQTGPIDPVGTAWNVVDTRNFPDEGVMRIAGQEYGYRVKTSGWFSDTIPSWRGTAYDPSAVATGSRVTNVPIPQSITEINSFFNTNNVLTSKEIVFRDVIPAPIGDWANSVNLQLYNTHISNLDRFSIQASAVPVTRAVGNLLTAFVQHVGDHRRHFRLSQLCGQIIDSSSWAASPVIEAVATVINQTIEELTQPVQLTVEAKRFVPASDKEIIIYWGDGQETTVTGTGTLFPRLTHTYDLKQVAQSKTYTIRVVVKDLDLDFSRWTTTQVVVRPKINPAGQPTKSTIRAGSKILLPGTISMTAGAKIKDQNTSSTTAGAKITLP
jgi:hypothetical protein